MGPRLPDCQAPPRVVCRLCASLLSLGPFGYPFGATWTASKPARKPFANLTASPFAQKWMEKARGALVASLETQFEEDKAMTEEPIKAAEPITELKGRTWVTRRDVHVDRIACGWLIRRFVDTDAVIRFVPGKGYVPKSGELRFDMFEGEFTHQGDRCSFEVLLARRGIGDAALQAIAEIVHDIDLKDNKFGREETTGIASLIAGIAIGNAGDEQRISQGAPVFDNLYQYFRTQRG
jgi:hypothetical protein